MRRLFSKLSLRRKLISIITLTSSLVLLLTIAAFLFFQWTYLRDHLLEETRILSRGISKNCAAALIFDDSAAADAVLDGLAIAPNYVGATLYDKDQRVFSRYRNQQKRDLWPEAVAEDRTGRFDYRFYATHLDVYTQVIHDSEFLGVLLVRADMDIIYRPLHRYVWIGAVAFILYSLLAFLLASVLQRLISDPVSTLALAMERVSREQDYSHRLAKRSNDELGQLFDGFNNMLAEIESRELELKQNEKHLDFLAHHDPLTQLANRRLFHARLEHSLSRSKRMKNRLAVLFIDLDRFKNINDSLGHDIGDRVLCQVAERLQAQVREADTIARVGGDEFVVIIEQVRKNDDIRRFVQKLLRELANPILISGNTLHVTATVGISLFPDNGEDPGRLLQASDVAMYKAKDDGRNSFQFFSPEMNFNTRESLLLENQLRNALSQDQLFLNYQPQFDLQNGRLVGFEALLRWQNPDLGLVAPVDFIALAEETGQIVAIGEWVLLIACQTLKKLQQQWQLPLRMAVNISPRQFQQEPLVQTVAEVLYRTQLQPGFLELEITEGMVMDNVEQAIQKMNEFKRMGVQLAIDDFGTGYSSLGYLKQFPISRLKIDQSFVRELESNASDQAIVNSVIALGKTMNLEIIAEGIETVGQYAFLKKQGCDQGQGFLLGRPMPEEQLPHVVDRPIALTLARQKSGFS